jgi:hypothetical protein
MVGSVPDSFWLLCGVVYGHSWQLHVVMHLYQAEAVQHSGDHSDLQHAGVSLHSEKQTGITMCATENFSSHNESL